MNAPRVFSIMSVLTVVAANLGPARAQPQFESAKLLASDGESGDGFGRSVAIFGDTAVVGAPFDSSFDPNDPNDPNDFRPGSAYVFRRDPNGAWFEEAKLVASDAVDFAFFGASVGIYGDTALIGAPEDQGNGQWSGSAYVFRRDPNGVWVEEAKLVDPNGAAWDWFGGSVAIHPFSRRMRAVIGAPGADASAFDAGMTYVFERDPNDVWFQEDRFLGPGETSAEFGRSVALFNGTAVVGAPWPGGGEAGLADAYHLYHDGWSHEATLADPDGMPGDEFGWSVAFSCRRAAVGAPLDDESDPNSGSVFIFRRTWWPEWWEEAKLLPSDGGAGDQFGHSVARLGTNTVVGAPFHDDPNNGIDSGCAYLFSRDPNDDSWAEQGRLVASDGDPNDQFGLSVAADDDTAIVGAPYDDDNGEDSGSAYIFVSAE